MKRTLFSYEGKLANENLNHEGSGTLVVKPLEKSLIVCHPKREGNMKRALVTFTSFKYDSISLMSFVIFNLHADCMHSFPLEEKSA